MVESKSPLKKRLIVCCDGTWMDSDGGKLEDPSNVTRLARAIKSTSSKNIPQIVYYQSGVGTGLGYLNQIFSGATGAGLSEHVREAYGFLANNYNGDDDVILVGFSRGAYTARAVCGLITKLGILNKIGMTHFYTIYNAMQSLKQGIAVGESKTFEEYVETIQTSWLNKNSKSVRAIAVWDTVGAMGIPSPFYYWKPWINRKHEFPNTAIDMSQIEYAFHALALDERRQSFSPTLWEVKADQKLNLKTKLKQCWFPGYHADVGGGNMQHQISDVTLAWIMEQLSNVAKCIDIDANYLRTQLRDGDAESEWAEGVITEAPGLLFKLARKRTREPGSYQTKEGSEMGEMMHASVRIRQKHMGSKWNCPALKDWKHVPGGNGEHKWEKKDATGNVQTMREEKLGKMELQAAGKRLIDLYCPGEWVEGMRGLQEGIEFSDESEDGNSADPLTPNGHDNSHGIQVISTSKSLNQIKEPNMSVNEIQGYDSNGDSDGPTNGFTKNINGVKTSIAA